MAFTMTPETSSALEVLNSGDNVLLTGKAGTGKSTLLRRFLDDQAVTTEGEILVLAPTGVAALNVGGSTIHRAFGFRPGMYPDDIRGFSGYHPGKATKQVLKTVRTIVIDEISMVRADLFDMMHLALTQIRRSSASFGGVRLILIGDLLQLPPVVTDNERESFLERWSTSYFFSAHCYPLLKLAQINLQTIWRQTDGEFIEILNQVRGGEISEEALSVLNSRVDGDVRGGDGFLTLTSRRRRVHQINRERLCELGTEVFESDARYEGETDDNAFPGDAELHYSVGARVMTVINDPQSRFVNGSMGTIVAADPESIRVELDDGPEVALERHTWEFRHPTVTNGSLSSEIIGTVTQFPVILSWAMTIHKSQGKTIPKCIIDLSGGTITDGQFYVALSRAVSLKNLYFTKPVQRQNVLADASLVRRILRDGSPERTPRRLLFLSTDHVDFGVSQHIARIHATVVEDNTITADFGSWINPMADLGSLVKKYAIPSGGMAATPTIEQFWALLLRQATGALVIGDGLATLERAVRHQARGMKVNLGVGYDIHDFNFAPSGDDPVSRCESMTQAYLRGEIDPRRGTAVTEYTKDEGALFIPAWAPTETPHLDRSRATRKDLAWAALSGSAAELAGFSELLEEVASQMADTAAQRGGWNTALRQELAVKVLSAGGQASTLPEVIDSADQIHEVLVPGARVAFTGGGVILGQTRSDEELLEICEARDLEFKKGMSKSRCDVLIADDISSMSNKAKQARQHGKPIFSTADFNTWYHAAELSPTPTGGHRAGATTPDPVPEVVLPPESSEPAVLESVPGQVPEPEEEASSREPAAAVLHPGVRVAVTGSVYLDGQRYTRGGDLEELIDRLGLEYKSSVSRTRCDVLIADSGAPVSGQLRSALEFGKPIVDGDDFAEWARQQLRETTTDPVAPVAPEVPVAAEPTEVPVVEPPATPAPPAPATSQPEPVAQEPSQPLRVNQTPVNDAAEATSPAAPDILETLLAGNDFRNSLPQEPANLLAGRQAATFATEAELNQYLARNAAALPAHPARVGKSIKRSSIVLGLAVVAFFVVAIAGGDATEGPWIAAAGIIMLAVIVGLPIAVIRAGYLAVRFKKDKQKAIHAVIREQLGGEPGNQLPVLLTGQRTLSRPESEILKQMCGFHDRLNATGYPIPVAEWRSLSEEALAAWRRFELTGTRREAERVGNKVSDWLAGAEAATGYHSRGR